MELLVSQTIIHMLYNVGWLQGQSPEVSHLFEEFHKTLNDHVLVRLAYTVQKVGYNMVYPVAY